MYFIKIQVICIFENTKIHSIRINITFQAFSDQLQTCLAVCEKTPCLSRPALSHSITDNPSLLLSKTNQPNQRTLWVGGYQLRLNVGGMMLRLRQLGNTEQTTSHIDLKRDIIFKCKKHDNSMSYGIGANPTRGSQNEGWQTACGLWTTSCPCLTQGKELRLACLLSQNAAVHKTGLF